MNTPTKFYKSLGFKEFEVIEELWGKENSCQIYVMALKYGCKNGD